MKWAISALLFYLLGVMVFLTAADFSIIHWVNAYYVWDKLKDVILITAIYALLPKYRKSIRWALGYAMIRVGWEVAAWIMELDVNGKKAVNSLFLVLATAVVVLVVKDLKEWQKQKRS